MRTCIIFRGESVRTKWGYFDAFENVENWRDTIFNVIDCDVVFFTYPSPSLDRLVETIKPVHVCTTGYSDQFGGILAACKWMDENKSKYDRFVISRFDVAFRHRITEWKCWNEKGITLVNRDVHWPRTKFYADLLFVVDTTHLSFFFEAVNGPNQYCLHHVGKNLYEFNTPDFHLMYDTYHHMHDHPLHAVRPLNPLPDLDNPYPGFAIPDISGWN